MDPGFFNRRGLLTSLRLLLCPHIASSGNMNVLLKILLLDTTIVALY